MKRIAYLLSIFVVLGSALLSTIALAEAQTNQAVSKTSRKVIAPLFNQLPPPDPGGGGGGGSICVTQRCYTCGMKCTAYSCWETCADVYYSAACSCFFSGGVCEEYGACDYTP